MVFRSLFICQLIVCVVWSPLAAAAAPPVVSEKILLDREVQAALNSSI